jgi:hypothetical protein
VPVFVKSINQQHDYNQVIVLCFEFASSDFEEEKYTIAKCKHRILKREIKSGSREQKYKHKQQQRNDNNKHKASAAGDRHSPILYRDLCWTFSPDPVPDECIGSFMITGFDLDQKITAVQ